MDADRLGARPIDRQYDWSTYIGHHNIQADWLQQAKRDNLMELRLTVGGERLALND